MKSFLFRLYLQVMRFLAHFTKINNKKIVILNGAGRSGSNGYLFAKYVRAHHPDYTVTLVEPWPTSHLSFKTWREIGAAKFILTTHQPFKIRKSQVNIQFWHGIPLKRMGIMANNTKAKDNRRNSKLWRKTADVVCSSSDLYETLMSACVGINAAQYRKLGFPRLDALSHPAISKQQLVHDLFNVTDEQVQVGIYMPTFRYELDDQNVLDQIKAGNFLALADFDGATLNETLKKQHQYLIVKLHPYEMRLFDQLSSQFSNIAFLNNDYLVENDYDLYELLGATDFLLTDFSSIYFDYLTLDKPEIFITNYLEQYEQKRGLLMGPYEEVVPGQCVKRQDELIKELRQVAQGEDDYKSKRQYWRLLTNQAPTQSSCEQIFDFMTQNY
ncbi:CDP-glycerol glycerophosphotransferase family protein [Lactobacillus sp. ESL0731]|uniref:CDP-glycerol glycerophosphotransferase family protein n=1 Tax=unclassified Lactobacillus TaxID=2620435 RepID=UPI0023FA0CC2|nr:MULTISPECIES: CDP-glycerol glycerophosphotransferase family protein [unclassified Lactobacillus]WEV51584.1 CDP-glycerol glycerophosphotransferase family protein [Lactobacillus sp. ESL0700]WEV62713.1 CDP-glycerol glycerophosphotransferase family protein [Lactobacillus sp. ESL0731]